MVIPVKYHNSPESRAIRDLFRNMNDKAYENIKGNRQKLIDLLYKLGYYECNESIYSEIKE